ncbi:LOW QUALITY PROTEIN: bifunctional 3'-5' exonuclease/ATP-dependent helicase WRN-like [Culicoides brevitarsis]|uniref:LOW QUALITY PROTEIN: bifunctional 3'-5' exonuclease/ATP-dependent helicase WRN-like n=1 Tax=Culicoides brevitarsis TaxID=469753 RepID=UPI00307C8ABE
MNEIIGDPVPEIDLDDFEDYLKEVTNDGPSQLHLEILKKHFSHENFRPMQWKVISAILNRQDNFAVMATGYGKSLCFQYPPVFMDGVGLVISPLISLMEDQVLSLNASNIPACYLNSAQNDRQVWHDVFKKKYRLVYVTPEFITSPTGERLLTELHDDLTLIAIDEAQCVSQWGHDFRPSYRQLSTLRQKTRGVPIVAVTATATDAVRDDIVRVLGLQNPLKSCSGFDRANLAFYVHLKGEGGPMSDLKPLIRQTPTGSIIIYCLTRKVTEDLVDQLRGNGIVCEAYHAGMTSEQRKIVHERFKNDKIRIICATIAFGMGIDKPDVRLVVHYGASMDIESYYQEVGRAGRDGKPAKCVTFYSRADFMIHGVLREAGRLSPAVKKNLEKLSDKMWDYLNTRNCRREFILNYFEGLSPKTSIKANCCDNCIEKLSPSRNSDDLDELTEDGKFDFSEDARKLLAAIKLFNGKKGLNASVLTLRGSKAKAVPAFAQLKPIYGSGKDKPDEWWKSLAILLDREGFLEKHPVGSHPKRVKMTFHGVGVTKKAQNWMKSGDGLKLTPTAEMLPLLVQKKNFSCLAFNSDLSIFVPKNEEKQDLMTILMENRLKNFIIAPILMDFNGKINNFRSFYVRKLHETKVDETKVSKLRPESVLRKSHRGRCTIL